MNKSKGNMYSWITATKNLIGGSCKNNCSYCLSAGSMILMADFTEKPIENIQVGDVIIGQKKINGKEFRRFFPSKVTNIMKRTSQKTIRILTNKGFLQCTPEHKIMGSTENRQGVDWKEARGYSPYQIVRFIGRTTNDTEEYLKGWLSGYIEGDGCFFITKSRPRKDGNKKEY
jgi:hypothetical protein